MISSMQLLLSRSMELRNVLNNQQKEIIANNYYRLRQFVE